ncbi:unnamed protein product [Rotaria sp. Silwood2]|nr:unnamed protein product [Rotaria sp. Silwood2]CAF3175355.1 unnamed protein product [Rotaria sp. Silwood2]CAF4172350.1 unnamed protein product [Rotaria sp. Silwood2]
MNQLITYNNANDGDTCRRYTGFPLNSTLVSSYTPDTIRTIITHAITGKPYTTSVWIRINSVGIQISAQDPQIARTRIPVFIPIGLAHDIFMQPNISNVICIVYDEVKSTMKGVLLYVVHPTDAHLLRDDFRIAKQLSYSKGIENQIIIDKHIPENNRLFSPTSQKQINEIYLNAKINRQQSPRRILYVRDNDIGLNRDYTPTAIPISLPQLSYAPFKGSYHSSRENSRNRRNKSPKKNKTGFSSNKPSNDSGSKNRRIYRSRSPQTQVESQLPDTSDSPELKQEQSNQEQEQEQEQQQPQQQQQQQQQMTAWQTAQQMPMIPMGVYQRYVPKVIPLATGETIKTTIPPSNNNGLVIAHIEPQQNENVKDSIRSTSRSRSVSLKRQDSQQQYRPLSAHNADASATLIQSAHHHHHHHRRHQINDVKYSLSKPDSNMYNTISHSFRTRANYISRTNNANNNHYHTDDENQTKQYLKQLIDDMHTMKLEMSKIRLASSSMGTTKGRSDSLRINLTELRNDIDAICARMAMTSKISKQ